MRRESSRMHLASASHPNNNATSPSIAQSPGGDNTSAHGAVWHEVRTLRCRSSRADPSFVSVCSLGPPPWGQLSSARHRGLNIVV